MVKKILANISPEETRIAILEDGLLAEVAVERRETENIVGNIYKGKIKNILPGMQAAFVDIGENKNAFLYTGETAEGNLIPVKTGDTVLSIGQDVLIQITKDSVGKKGPRGTLHLTLPGRYTVLMPTVEYIGISRRITDESERERLKKIAGQLKPGGMGIIIRTVAEGKSGEELQKDISYLHKLWTALLARFKREPAPLLLYRDVDLIIRIVRDYLTDDVSEFIIDDREAFGRVCDLLSYISPEYVAKIKIFNDPQDLFFINGIESALHELTKRQVMLDCGGYLVFDQTEALTVIDVNTGSFVGTTNLSDTVFRTNMEAADEIARQIRLRDIGGIIIVDFIDMENDDHRNTILNYLQERVKGDRTKTNVLGWTSLGLVEITRKKSRRNVTGILYSDCPLCEGWGRIQSPETVAVNIRRQLRRIVRQHHRGMNILVQVNPQVAGIFGKKGEINALQQELFCTLTVESVANMHPETFSILEQTNR